MAENPIKVFATRAERYPEPTEADMALGAGRAALAVIPVIGGTLTEVLSLVLAPAVSRRRDAWLKELADGLEDAERKIDGFKIENLAQDEAFVSAVIEATRIAVSTHQHEKRILLRNALMNIATGRGPSEDMQHIYLRRIDEFTPTHVKLLNFLWRGAERIAAANNGAVRRMLTYQQVFEQVEPGMQREHQLIQHALSDLKANGLITLQNMSASYPMQVMTNAGIDFLRFILAPEDLP